MFNDTKGKNISLFSPKDSTFSEILFPGKKKNEEDGTQT